MLPTYVILFGTSYINEVFKFQALYLEYSSCFADYTNSEIVVYKKPSFWSRNVAMFPVCGFLAIMVTASLCCTLAPGLEVLKPYPFILFGSCNDAIHFCAASSQWLDLSSAEKPKPNMKYQQCVQMQEGIPQITLLEKCIRLVINWWIRRLDSGRYPDLKKNIW